MPVLRRLSPTLRAYIREEYRRVWTRREYLTLLFAVLAVEAVRFGATWVALANQQRPGPSSVELLSLLGFSSTVAYAVRFPAFIASGWRSPFWAVGELLGCLTVLAPYYAGRSVSSARKFRDIDDLKARGLSSDEIMLGRGIAHLAPVLAAIPIAVLLSLATTLSALLLAGGRTSRTGISPFNDPLFMGLELLVLVLVVPIGSLVRLSAMICVSALNRRVWGGVAGCFALSLLLFPALGLLVRHSGGMIISAAFTAQGYFTQIILPNVLGVLTQIAVFAALLPMARRALAGKPPIPLPKMEEPRSLWVEDSDHAAAPGE